MNAGDLRFKMVVETPVGREDDYRAVAEEFASAFEINVSLTPLNQRELDRAAAVSKQTTHRIGCRYHPAINTKCRFRYGTRIFDIESVINKDERNTELEISVVEHG